MEKLNYPTHMSNWDQCQVDAQVRISLCHSKSVLPLFFRHQLCDISSLGYAFFPSLYLKCGLCQLLRGNREQASCLGSTRGNSENSSIIDDSWLMWLSYDCCPGKEPWRTGVLRKKFCAISRLEGFIKHCRVRTCIPRESADDGRYRSWDGLHKPSLIVQVAPFTPFMGGDPLWWTCVDEKAPRIPPRLKHFPVAQILLSATHPSSK